MKNRTHRFLLLIGSAMFAGSTTVLAWFWTATFAFAGNWNGAADYLFMAVFLASSFSLIGFWALVLIFCANPICRNQKAMRVCWVLTGVGAMLATFGLILVMLSGLGVRFPDALFGFVFCIYGLPVLIPLTHLLWLRSVQQPSIEP